METDGRYCLSQHARAWLLGLLAGLSGMAYYVLVSMSLNPKLNLTYDVRGARYGGPLT